MILLDTILTIAVNLFNLNLKSLNADVPELYYKDSFLSQFNNFIYFVML